LFIICEFINEKWNRKQIHGDAEVHYPFNGGKGKFNGKSDMIKHRIIKLEYRNGSVIIIPKFSKMKGNRKE
jgi:hypothetical protein